MGVGGVSALPCERTKVMTRLPRVRSEIPIVSLSGFFNICRNRNIAQYIAVYARDGNVSRGYAG